MIARFDNFSKFETPLFYVCNPGCKYINGSLSSVAGILIDISDVEIVFNFNTTSELNFRAYKVCRNDPDEDAHTLRLYKSLRNRRLIFVDDVGFFVITSVTESYDGGMFFKDISAQSCEVEIENIMIPYIENNTYKFHNNESTGLFDMMMRSLPMWTVGEIDPNVESKYRTFEDVDVTENILGFMLEQMQDAYECIFVFDIINRVVNVYDQGNYVRQTNIHLSHEDLISSLEVEELSDELYTALSVYGEDDLSINSINPLGTSVIYKFDYYYDWMSDGLREKVEAWEKLVKEKEEQYYSIQLERYSKLTERSTLSSEIEMYNLVYELYKKCSDNAVASASVEDIRSYNEAIREIGAKLGTDLSSLEIPEESSYVWIKFATDSVGTNLSGSPVGREYIGVAYNKGTKVASIKPSDYSWYKFRNGSSDTPGVIPGSSDGKYTWVAFDRIPSDRNSQTSDSAKLTVIAPGVLSILSEPVSMTVANGSRTTFTISASGTGITYQWQYSFDNGKTWTSSTAGSAKTASYTVTGDINSNNGVSIRCIVGDSSGNRITSSVAKLIVVSGAPVITKQPKNVTVANGAKGTFTIAAVGKGLTYQWQYSFDNGDTWTSSTASAAKTTNYVVTGSGSNNGVSIRCVVKDSDGNETVSSVVRLIVVLSGMAITAQPSDVNAANGSNAVFSVIVIGAGLKFQWQCSSDNGSTWVNYTGTGTATSSITVRAESGTSGYLFRCVVYGSVNAIEDPDSAKYIGVAVDKNTQAVSSSKSAYTWEALDDDIVGIPDVLTRVSELEELAMQSRTNKETQLEAVDTDLAQKEEQINAMHNAVAIDKYFTQEEYDELSNYIIQGSYTDDYITITDSMDYAQRMAQMKTLYSRGREQLNRVAYPTQKFTVDVQNFIFVKEFAYWSEQLETGCLINVELETDDVAQLFLTQFTVNYTDKSLSMEFGNRFNRFDAKALFDDVLGGISRTANTLSYIKDTIYPIKSGEFNAMKEALESSRNLTKNAVMSSDNEQVVIDDTGYTGRRRLPDGTLDPKQIKINGRNIVFTDDAWETCKTAIGEILLGDNASAYGINAEILIGNMIVGNEMHIIDSDGNDMFQVTEDKIKVSFSDTFATKDEAGIAAIEAAYAIGNDSVNPPSSGWTTSIPESVPVNKYLWTRTIVSYRDGRRSDPSYSVNRTSGVSISSIDTEYNVSTSNARPDGTWSSMVENWDTTKYIWTRSRITWDDGSVTATEPILDTDMNSIRTDIVANARGVEQISEFTQNISGQVDRINAYIQTGLVDYDESGKAIFGVRVGENLQRVNAYIRSGAEEFGAEWLSDRSGGAAIEPVTDIMYVIQSSGSHLGEMYMWNGAQYEQTSSDGKMSSIFTSTELGFYDTGEKTAYFSNKNLNVRTVRTDKILLSPDVMTDITNNNWQIGIDNGFYLSWVGSN